ncbi:hypothetical protein WG66_008450 [Moniliophthora roreri]|nr:hypothetical protein WG66_008450 [Moniliophthora roreri]
MRSTFNPELTFCTASSIIFTFDDCVDDLSLSLLAPLALLLETQYPPIQLHKPISRFPSQKNAILSRMALPNHLHSNQRRTSSYPLSRDLDLFTEDTLSHERAGTYPRTICWHGYNYLLSAISHQQLEVYDTHDTTQTRLSSATIELCLESRVLEVNSRRGQPSQLKRFVSYDSAVRNYFIGVPRLAPIDYETLLLVNPTLASRVFKRR